MIQVHADAGEAVGAQRTVRAPGLVVGMEHEVVDDELTAAGEEVGERLLAVGAIEDVLLVDAFPRQVALQRLNSSPWRVNAFSFSSSARRAASHSSCDTTG